MLKIVITKEGVEEPVFVTETENRSLARAWAMVCETTTLTCVVTEEVKPRAVKFKGIG